MFSVSRCPFTWPKARFQLPGTGHRPGAGPRGPGGPRGEDGGGVPENGGGGAGPRAQAKGRRVCGSLFVCFLGGCSVPLTSRILPLDQSESLWLGKHQPL